MPKHESHGARRAGGSGPALSSGEHAVATAAPPNPAEQALFLEELAAYLAAARMYACENSRRDRWLRRIDAQMRRLLPEGYAG